MKTQIRAAEPVSRTIQARGRLHQAGMAEVLQAYRNQPAQLAVDEEDDRMVQGKFATQLQDEEEETLQGKIVAQLQSTDEEEPVQQKVENRTGLPDRIKNGVENLSGYSLDAVKVHYNSSKPAQLQALAYTQGTDIHVGPGQECYLGHEAWHVVQQMQGRVQPTTQLQGIAVNDNEGLEREADVMGGKALDSIGKQSGKIKTEYTNKTKQFKVSFYGSAEKYDPTKTSNLDTSVYKSQYETLDQRSETVDVLEVAGLAPWGQFNPAIQEIQVRAITADEMSLALYPGAFATRVGTLAHEMQHAIDFFENLSLYAKVIHLEWRAWAVQAAVAYKNQAAGIALVPRDQGMLNCFLNNDFNTIGNAFFEKTKLYLKRKFFSLWGNVLTWMYIHFSQDWINEARNLFETKCRQSHLVEMNSGDNDEQETWD